MDIQDQVAIVTGGASGMGAATAKMLSQTGAKVAIFDLHLPKVSNKDVIAIQCDVSDEKSVAQAFAKVEKQLGAARICINCAGVVHGRRMVNREGLMPSTEFDRVMKINVLGTFNVMSMAAAHMMNLTALADDERGIIINTASVAAFEGQIGQTAYSASKGAIVSMTLPAARELAQFGIRVMAIAPGLVDTPMFDKISAEARAALHASVPFPKRLANPSEFAALVAHIITNRMLNGEVIRLDGALRMAPK